MRQLLELIQSTNNRGKESLFTVMSLVWFLLLHHGYGVTNFRFYILDPKVDIKTGERLKGIYLGCSWL